MKQKSKLLSLLLAVVMTFSLAVPAMAVEVPDAGDSLAGKIVILHTNDTHGGDMVSHGVDKAADSIGTAGVAQLKKDYEAAGAQVLLLSAGDAIQGAPIVNLDKGVSEIGFMNAAGYDAMAPGNHEFDYGYENLKSLAASMDFPLLAANIVDKATQKPVFQTSVIFVDGLTKVGVFGLATPETASKANPKYVEGLEFLQGEALYACAQAQVDALEQEGCDLIVALGHLGVDPESAPNRSIDVCEYVKGIDLFVDGHSHSTNEEVAAQNGGSNVVDGTLLVSTGTKLANVGVVVYDPAAESLEYGAVAASDYTGSDAAVDKAVTDRNTAVDEELSAVFAKTEVDLDGERAPGVRTQETNLGDFATDAILWQAREYLGQGKVDAAITNGGGIRASIPAGDISMKTMKTVFPFGNTVATVTLTGAQLLEALEAATCSTPTAIGAFPQVSGISFTIDTTVPYENGAQYGDTTYFAPAAPGARIKDVTIDGAALDLTKEYTIATNDFTAAGGDTYYVFKQAKLFDTTVAMEDALVNYTRDVLGGTITAEQYGAPAGRITVLKDVLADYGDVSASAWYADAARFVLTNGLMNGTGKASFAPEATVTRGMVYQTLYNMAGKPAVAEAATFSDVSGKWYADAAAWAEDQGLTTGVGKGLFGGEKAMTRQELAKVFADYAETTGIHAANMELTAFTDAADVASWAKDGMERAVALGILSGSKGRLMPTGTAQRSQLAQMLKQFSGLEPTYTVEHITVQNGSRQVPAIVTMPASASKDNKVPAVIMDHGHGGSKDENVGFGGIAAALAQEGIATIRMDFPGCGESKEPFTENYLSNMISDSNACKAYLLANYPVDPDAIGILGYSMGGRIAATLAGEKDNDYKAVVLLAGAVSDGRSLIATIMGGDDKVDAALAQAEQEGKYTLTTQYGQVQDLSPEWFHELIASQPLAGAASYTGPVLVMHGDKDTTVPAEVNELSLKAFPNATEIVVKDADHGYGFYSDQPDVTAAVEGGISGFFFQHLLAKTTEQAA